MDANVRTRSEPLEITVLTIFPELFPGPLGHSLIGRALERGMWRLRVVSLRDYATDRHHSVDDSAFGGGAGMVMRPDVIDAALRSVTSGLIAPRLIYLTPRGTVAQQPTLETWAQERRPLVFLCGRFEGVDQRVLDLWDFEEMSLGDFVVCGGELPLMVLIEGCVRLLDGVLGNPDSLLEESFSRNSLLEYPHYTHPRHWEGHSVPDVLLSGHHKKIAAWRTAQAKEITKKRRPDLWAKYCLYVINEKDME